MFNNKQEAWLSCQNRRHASLFIGNSPTMSFFTELFDCISITSLSISISITSLRIQEPVRLSRVLVYRQTQSVKCYLWILQNCWFILSSFLFDLTSSPGKWFDCVGSSFWWHCPVDHRQVIWHQGDASNQFIVSSDHECS